MDCRRAAVLLPSILVLSTALLLPACRSATPPATDLSILAPDEGGPSPGDQRRTARQEWFLRQRLHPFQAIDEDLRGKAFREMRRMEQAPGLASQTDSLEKGPVWVPIGPAPTESYYPDN
ncbi:MAG TPA: hypothetical protein VNA04_18300 [Thermoanaerobaculia bacterium]|nr:hypothetical protein [Thermoanaerobaculia bacterium]